MYYFQMISEIISSCLWGFIIYVCAEDIVILFLRFKDYRYKKQCRRQFFYTMNTPITFEWNYGNRVTVSLKTLLRLYESYVENYKNGIGCSIDIPGKYVPRPVRLIIASTGYICGAKIFIDNEWLFLCTMPMYRDNCDTLCIHMPRYENLCIIIGQ